MKRYISALFVLACACGGGGETAGEPDAAPDVSAREIRTVEVLPDLPAPPDTRPDTPQDLSQDLSQDEPGPPPDTDGDGLSDPQEEAIGTDPLMPDTDTDGVWDGQEVQEGTDPLDPSDALRWRPDWTGHPRLVFGPDRLPEVRERAIAPEGPFATLLARVEGAATKTAPVQPEGDYDAGVASQRARIARAAAFLAMVRDDGDMASKALALLSDISPHVDRVGIEHPRYNKTDIHVAEALSSYAVAADWLFASGLIDDDERSQVEASLAALVLTFETEVTMGGDHWYMLAVAQNNHNIKTFSSIALAGMLLNHRPEAARWVSRGLSEALHVLLDFQTVADGGYAEGPAYLNYGAGEFLATIWAVTRVPGPSVVVKNTFDTWTSDDPAQGLREVGDLSQDELLHQLFRWPLHLAMPDAMAPNIDDSGLATWLGAAYGWLLFQDPELLWLWRRQGMPSSGGSDLAADLFALLPDPLPDPPAPQWLDLFLYDSGHAVFRTGWTETDDWLLVLGEHGPARIHGTGHEHPDANALALVVNGEYLLLDSGYVRWEDKELVCHPENHNIILVDGKGPPDGVLDRVTGIGTDAWLTDWQVKDDHRTVASTARYREVDFGRRVVWIPGELLLIHDTVSASKNHEYSWLLHGNGGGDSGGEFQTLSGAAACWSRPGAQVSLRLAAEGPELVCDDAEDAHSLHHGQVLSHRRLRCRQTTADTSFLGALRFGPEPPEEAGADGWLGMSWQDQGAVWWVGARGEGAADQVQTPCGPMIPPLDLALRRCSPDGPVDLALDWSAAPLDPPAREMD